MTKLQKTVCLALLALGFAGLACGGDIQGVVADWNCVKPMVRNGREKALKDNRSCSLMKNYSRSAYGLITDDKKFYRLDDAGIARVKELLKNTPDKDNLKVIITGDVEGGLLKVSNISLL